MLPPLTVSGNKGTTDFVLQQDSYFSFSLYLGIKCNAVLNNFFLPFIFWKQGVLSLINSLNWSSVGRAAFIHSLLPWYTCSPQVLLCPGASPPPLYPTTKGQLWPSIPVQKHGLLFLFVYTVCQDFKKTIGGWPSLARRFLFITDLNAYREVQVNWDPQTLLLLTLYKQCPVFQTALIFSCLPWQWHPCPVNYFFPSVNMELCISLKSNREMCIMFTGNVLTMLMLEQQNRACLDSGTANTLHFL